MSGKSARTVRWLAAVTAALLAAGSAAAGEKIHEEVPAPADGVVRVENLTGSVVVTVWNEKKVLVEGTLGDNAERVRVDADETGVEVEVVLPRRVRHVDDTDLRLRVPRGSDVEVETVSASVEVEGVEGALDVETVSGEVRVRKAGEDVAVETVSGAVRVESVEGLVRIESVSGPIDVAKTRGSAELSTTSGGITVHESQLDDLDCESVSGAIDLDLDVAGGGSYDVDNLSGTVTLLLDEDVSASIDVETFSGSIRSEFDGRIRTEEIGPGSSLAVRNGDGDADITVSTFSGLVTLNKR
jgi:DUF4097 and DUF4098 domain-containing protein YvlB